MKVGIYGDSFADSAFPTNRTNTLNWMEVLQEKYDVSCFGIVGSSLYFSIEQFKQQQDQFDKVIFLVTEPSRLWAKGLMTEPTKMQFFGGVDFIEGRIEYYKNLRDRPLQEIKHLLKISEAALIYKSYIQNFEEEEYKHNLMLKDLLKNKNIISIPCFHNSIQGNETSLWDIYKKETLAWGVDLDSISKYEDVRNCHLTVENNRILAEKIIDSIENNNTSINLNLDDFMTPMNKEFYLIPT